MPSSSQSLLVRVGVGAWCIVGIVAVLVIVASVFASVSSVALPLLFAIVLAVLFRPVARWLEQRRVPGSLAAGLVVLGLVSVCVGVLALTVSGILTQTDLIIDAIESGLAQLDLDDATIADIRQALEDLDPAVTSGFVMAAITGISAIGGFLVGALLGILIMYYLIKDGDHLRAQLLGRASPQYVAELQEFMAESAFVLRRYWLGRTIVSAVVAAVVGAAALLLDLPLVPTLVVVTFIGGYVPYIGAVLGGMLAVVVALGSNGVVAAVVMLAVVLIANLLIENLVDPAVTGRTLRIHPLVVLLVTTLGGIVGGLVGLIMAVPLTVIGVKAFVHLRRVVDVDAEAVRESLRRAVDGSSEPSSATSE